MALATHADVEAAAGRPLDAGSVDLLIEEASDLVVGYLRYRPADPVHPEISRAVATVVVAVLDKPATTTADYKAGGYYQQREVATVNVGTESATTTGPWLTASVKMRLRPFLRRKAFSIVTIDETKQPPTVGTDPPAWWGRRY